MLRNDLTGQRFGRLLVTSFVKTNGSRNFWNCICDCGNEIEVRQSNLLCSNTKSCGCLQIESRYETKHPSRIKDISGRRFGRLLVLSLDHVDKAKNYWLCKCDCGNESIVSKCNLIGGSTQSCGCSRLERKKLSCDEASFRSLYTTYKHNAKTRDLVFDIEVDYFRGLVVAPCCYCNRPPSTPLKRADGSIFMYNGIDRVDNSVGYTRDNTVSCCRKCNFAKQEMSKDDFLQLIKDIYTHNFGDSNDKPIKTEG